MSKTMTDKFDVVVYIGRFQPFHKGHLAVMEFAYPLAEQVLILVGSANRHRTTRNPFDAVERMLNVSRCLCDADMIDRTEIASIDDHPYDLQAWIAGVQARVKKIYPDAQRIGIIGHERDASLFYHRWFPQWEFIEPKVKAPHLNATAIRECLFGNPECLNENSLDDMLPPDSKRKLEAFVSRSPVFRELQEEYRFETAYRKQWGRGPFQIADVVVVKSGHVLTIRRKERPGKGKQAVPGGFVNFGETIADAAMREWWEEAHLAGYLNKESFAAAMWPHFRGRERFDDPWRSCRAHIITEAFYFKLPDEMELPTLRAGDDAAEAFWTPLSEVSPLTFFEDHGFIIPRISKFL